MVETTHQIIDTKTQDKYNLSLVQNYTLQGENSVIIYESASGEGGLVINNGPTTDNLPISGTLIADTPEQLSEDIIKLTELRRAGGVIEFLAPIKATFKSNKYTIKSTSFLFEEGVDTYSTFNITLVEFKQANIQRMVMNPVSLSRIDLVKSNLKLREKKGQ